MYSVSSLNDTSWKKRHLMIHDIFEKYINKNNLTPFYDDIMSYFQNFMNNMYHKTHVFDSSEKMNQYILSNIHTYINTLTINKKKEENAKINYTNPNALDEFRQQRDKELAISQPEPIDFKDKDIHQYKSDTKLLVEQEINQRKQSILPDIREDKYIYFWLDDVLQEKSEYIIKISQPAKQTILKSIFFKEKQTDNFPDYMKVCTSENKFAWFFRTNHNVLHYEGNLNINPGRNNMQFIFENETTIDKKAHVQIMQIQ